MTRRMIVNVLMSIFGTTALATGIVVGWSSIADQCESRQHFVFGDRAFHCNLERHP